MSARYFFLVFCLTLSSAAMAADKVPPPPVVTCSMNIPGSASSTTPYLSGSGNGFITSAISCPVGVGALDVTRITWSPFEGANRSQNVMMYSAAAFVRYQQEPSRFLGIMSQSKHDIEFATPLRLFRTADEMFSLTYGCSSGISGYGPTCSGTVYFTGTPAGN